MNKALALFLVPALAQAASPASSSLVSPAEKTAAQAITENVIRGHVRFLASDLLEGRAPASRGDVLAQQYVQAQMEALGLEAGAPGGGWIQKVPLVGIVGNVPQKTTLSKGSQKVDLALHEDFAVESGVQTPEAKVENAEVVFVGYGIVAPEYQWDDYKGVDLKGKVILMMNNDPEDDPKLFAGKTRLWYGRWVYKYMFAARMGAIGAFVIHTQPSAGYPWQVVTSSWSRERFELPYEGEPRVEIKGWFTEDASKKIAALGGQDLDRLRAAALKRDFRPVPLGVTFSMAIDNKVQTKDSANVIGRLPGSDSRLSREAVVYTAHHDHLGMKTDPKPGEDAIYNGALDNASGVSAMLAIAKAFIELPKRRRSNRDGSPPTSTSTGSGSSGAPRTSRWWASVSRPSTPSSCRSRRCRDGSSSPTSSRTAASSTAPTSSTWRRWESPRRTSTAGPRSSESPTAGESRGSRSGRRRTTTSLRTS